MLNLSQGHHRMVYSVAWSPDGHQTTERCNLFSAGFDNKVIGWKVTFWTATVVGCLASHQETLCTALSVLLFSFFVFVSVCTDFCTVCGFDILVSYCNSAGLVDMLSNFVAVVLQWVKMCNMGDRPVAIALIHQFMILQQVTELHDCLCYALLAKVLALFPGHHQAFWSLFCVCWGIVPEYHIVCTTWSECCARVHYTSQY